MVATVGSLNVNATLQTAAFDKGVDKIQGRLKGLQGSFASAGAKMSSIGKNLSVGLTLPFAALISKAIPAAKQSREALGQVNAALASMGPVAGKTSEQLQAAAKGLQGLSTFDDDDILQKVTANMLTFGNVAGEQFDRAQLAAVNLSARMGTDLQSSALMLGKALNSPAEGIAKLSRAGIQFTEQQKAQIIAMTKAGDVAGAQKIMLAELERQFGGSAAAMRAADPAAALTNTWNDFQETIGEIALKVLPPLTTALSGLLDKFNQLTPGQQKFALGVAGVAAALGPVMMVLGPVVGGFGKLVPLVATLAPLIGTLGKALFGLAVAGGPLTVIALAVGAVYLAWRNWDKIKPIVVGLYNTVKTYVLDKLNVVWDAVKAKLQAVGDWFKGLWDRVVGHSYIPDMVDQIGEHMRRLDSLMVRQAQSVTSKTAQAFQALQTTVQGLLARLFPEEARHNQFLAELQALQDYAAKAKMPVDQLAQAIARLRAEYSKDTAGVAPPDTPSTPQLNLPDLERVPTLADKIASAFQGIANDAMDGLSDAITSVVMGTQSLGAAFGDMARSIIADIVRMTVKMLLFRAISGVIGGAFGGGGGGFMPGAAESFPGWGSTGDLSKIPRFATGGSFNVLGRRGVDQNMLSLNSLPIAKVSHGERINVGNGGGGGATVNIHVDARDALVEKHVRQMVAEGIAQAAPVLVRASTDRTMRSLSRPRIS